MLLTLSNLLWSQILEITYLYIPHKLSQKIIIKAYQVRINNQT